MNIISITGRLTADAEYQSSQNNNSFAHFDIADNHGKDKEGKDEVTFFRCTAFGKTAERVAKTFKKGLLVSVAGQLKVRPYVDNKNQNRTSNDVNVSAAYFPMVSAPNDQQTQSAPSVNTGYGTPPASQGYGAPPAANGYAAPPVSNGPRYAAPPVGPQQYGTPPASNGYGTSATAPAQYTTDPQGNQYQLINGAWQLIRPAAPAPGVPTFPPAGPNTPF